ncbi:MAG TPA: MFS transporter [Anaerolineae bacterium]|nr:MFS transporter [Anaerolineae bacterium]HID84292.1 MFS transporter [Anaerolineales bacterium]HIQ08875.1 MFS transporter [Anaerolineaceae bacterium]
MFRKDRMFPRFALYGFLKNLRFFEPFLILIFREAGLSFTLIGTLYAIRDTTTYLLEVPTGVLADAFGRRKAMLMAFGAYLVSFAVFYWGRGFGWFALAMILFAVGEAFRSGTHKALILEYLKLNRMEHLKVSYYGRTRSASQFGSAINALIAAALAFYTGSYRIMFLAAAVPYVLDFINLATYPPELDGELTALRWQAVRQQARQTWQDFRAMFTDRQVWRAILNSASFMALFKATKDYLQPILEQFALALPVFLAYSGQQRGAVVVGVVYFFIYLSTSYASRNADRFSRRFANLAQAINRSYLLGVFLLALAGAVTWGGWTGVAIVAYLGFYVLHNLRRPMNVAYISDQIASRVMASGLSVESVVRTLLASGLALLLGVLADLLGVGPALAVLAFLIAALFPILRVE